MDQSPGRIMDRQFLDYYNAELAFLLKQADEFAKAHSKEAEALRLDTLHGRDPHVERLLQGFAFLTARIRKKIDDEYPEISDALLSILYPHYQRPIPSMAMVQFEVPEDASKLISGQRVSRLTELVMPPVSEIRCQFRTAYEVTLWPVEVRSVEVETEGLTQAGKPAGTTAVLRLGLSCTAQGSWEVLEEFDRLRFYLDGPEPLPTALYECLLGRLCGVRITGRDADGKPLRIDLAIDDVKPVGFEPEQALLPYPERSFPGNRLLQEFFTFPQKFLFFDLCGLSKLKARRTRGPIEVQFYLSSPPRTEVVPRTDCFRLGCTPAVNLFELVTEEIALNHLQTKYPVVPRYGAVGAYEVIAVERVIGRAGFIERKVDYKPFYEMRHAARDPSGREETSADLSALSSTSYYWFESRRPSLRKNDDGLEVDLQFSDVGYIPKSPSRDPAAPGEPLDDDASAGAGSDNGTRRRPEPSTQVITAYCLCSNRDLPVQIRISGAPIEVVAGSEGAVGAAHLLSRPQRSFRPGLGRSSQWPLISALGLNHLSLIEQGEGALALRSLLKIHDFVRSEVSQNMIQGVVDVRSRQVPRRTGRKVGNTFSLGVEITVTFNEDQFHGSLAFVLASVLDRFFGAYVTINSFTQTVALSNRYVGEWKRWPPRCGNRTLV